MSQLFRKESIEHATHRLEGAVMLALPPSVTILSTLFSGFLFIAIWFAANATYSRTANVPGWLVPDHGMIRATSQTAGLVKSIYVREGASVKVGQTIAEIAVAGEIAGGNAGDAISKGMQAESAALKAKAHAAVEKLNAEARQVERRLDALSQELVQARNQLSILREKRTLSNELVTQSAGIAAKGYLPKKEFDARRHAAMQADIDVAQQARQINVLERDIAEARSRLTTIPLEIKSALAESGNSQASLAQRMADAESRRILYIVAPIAGKIAALPVVIGQTVTSTSTIAIVIAADDRLEAELLVPTRSAGFIRVGQDVRLMLQAFPHQRFGTVPATISSISMTVLGPTEVSIPGIATQEPVFRVRASISRDQIRAYGEQIALQPGMLLNAEVVFDRRTLLQWLFDPIYAMRPQS